MDVAIHFEIKNYQITLGDRTTSKWSGEDVRARGIVACFGDNQRILFYFMPEGESMPDPIANYGARLVVLFLPFNVMHAYVDILRNEAPIFGNLDLENPEETYISTMHEPVGEGELGKKPRK
jgi:hypothetical protein